MAGCATRASFAGHPGIAGKADDELTIKLDHLMGSGHWLVKGRDPHAPSTQVLDPEAMNRLRGRDVTRHAFSRPGAHVGILAGANTYTQGSLRR